MLEINQNIGQLLNNQFNKELCASDICLQMALWFEHKDWVGSSHWMYCQAKEERDHALMIARFLSDREWFVKVDTTKKKTHAIGKKIDDIWSDALVHEKLNTESIKKL